MLVQYNYNLDMMKNVDSCLKLHCVFARMPLLIRSRLLLMITCAHQLRSMTIAQEVQATIVNNRFIYNEQAPAPRYGKGGLSALIVLLSYNINHS